jgi:hypothetical protein
MPSNKRQQAQASALRVLQTKDETRAFYDKDQRRQLRFFRH